MRTLACLVVLLGLPGVCAARSDEDRFRESGVAYAGQVHELLHARWRTFTQLLHTLPPGDRLREDEALAVTVELALWPDGTVVRVERTAGSGVAGFDDAPADLLADVGRLPAPPAALRSDDGRVYLRWRFDRASADADVGLVFEHRLPIEEAVERLVEAGSADRAALRVIEEMAERPDDRARLLLVMADAVARHAAAASDGARRAAAARALGFLDEGDALLAVLAGDAEAAVRAEALESLGRRAPVPRALSLLTRALGGEQASAAARALEQLGERAALSVAEREQLRAPLREALLSGRAPAEAALALRSLGDGAAALDATRALLKQPAALAAGARAAMQLADPALEPALVAALAEAAPEARALLLDALGAIGAALEPAGRSAVLRALADPDGAARAEAVRAAGLIGERRYQSRLVDALADPEAGVRAAAVAALVAVAGDKAVDELFRPLRDSSPAVRASLAAALVAHPLAGAAGHLRRLRSDSCPLVLAAAGAAAPASAEPLHARLLATASDPSRELDRARAAAEWLARGDDGPAAPTATPATALVVSSIAR